MIEFLQQIRSEKIGKFKFKLQVIFNGEVISLLNFEIHKVTFFQRNQMSISC